MLDARRAMTIGDIIRHAAVGNTQIILSGVQVQPLAMQARADFGLDSSRVTHSANFSEALSAALKLSDGAAAIESISTD
jgi:hypothetical protein